MPVTASSQTPIALFLYNRPAQATYSLESLSRCYRLNECRLHIYCDGPKRPEHVADVSEVRRIAREWGELLGAEVIERDSNLGLARSIVNGVTELCDRYGRAIVVEDDLVLSPSFLDYMLSALERYADETNVYQISGYMFPIDHGPGSQAFFLPQATTWGWATWTRAWRIFDWNPTDALEILKDKKLRRQFELDGSYPYATMLEQRLADQNDSCGILFWWAIFKAGGLALHPRKTFVSNRGFDGTGTHCSDQSWVRLSSLAPVDVSFSLPDEIVIDTIAFEKIKRFLQKENPPTSFTARIWRRIEQFTTGASTRQA